MPEKTRRVALRDPAWSAEEAAGAIDEAGASALPLSRHCVELLYGGLA